MFCKKGLLRKYWGRGRHFARGVVHVCSFSFKVSEEGEGLARASLHSAVHIAATSLTPAIKVRRMNSTAAVQSSEKK